jgi:hypothetical protein
VWSSEVLNLLGPANIKFDYDGLCRLRYIAFLGFIDCRFSEHDGKPLVEFSWQGHDDNADACGRGWAAIEDDGKLRGRIFIHCANDSAFTAERK